MSIWQFLKDPPNSVAILVSVAWPLGVWFLARRRVQGVPNLEVMAKPGATHIGERPYDAIEFTFQNLTGQIVYISKVQLRENAKTLHVPEAAVFDIATGWRQIKVLNGEELIDHQRILQTGESAFTSIALSEPLTKTFHRHRPNLICRLLQIPKYYMLQYTVMVGEHKYSVLTVF